jgi:carbon starvation protein CstA
VILRLPASTILIITASVIAGLALGLVLAVVFLRAADDAAARYHRALIADILDRSSVVHRLVHEIVANANARIALLRLELDTLKETQS